MAVVAIMLDSPALFYMATALFATMAASHLQARLAAEALRFDRIAPASVRVGELVTVEITVWSTRKIRRPLITLHDILPPNLTLANRTPSLPIAPAFDVAISTQYQFRPLKRGVYHWSKLVVEGTDALGIVVRHKEYETAPAEMTVLPRPIPVAIDVPTSAGWGISEAESGQTRGAGIEPRGVREYVTGDSLRHVHWRSTARVGRLLVKEFEAGTHASAAFIFQRTTGTDIGTGVNTTLEMMCGHAAFLAEQFLREGTRVEFPGLEQNSSHASLSERTAQVYDLLARVEADQSTTVAEEVSQSARMLPPGSLMFLMIAVQELDLPGAIMHVGRRGASIVPLVYDPRKLQPNGRVESAADPAYIQRLRGAGAAPIVMPMEAVK